MSLRWSSAAPAVHLDPASLLAGQSHYLPYRIQAMARLSMRIERVLQSPDLRILSVMVAGIAVFGVVDGSLWRGLLTPTLAYRPAILFGLTLVFGWRGFVWSQLLFFISFAAFLGFRGAVFVTPLSDLSRLRIGCCPATREERTLAFAGEIYAGISGRRRPGACRAGVTEQHGVACCWNPAACRRSEHSR